MGGPLFDLSLSIALSILPPIITVPLAPLLVTPITHTDTTCTTSHTPHSNSRIQPSYPPSNTRHPAATLQGRRRHNGAKCVAQSPLSCFFVLLTVVSPFWSSRIPLSHSFDSPTSFITFYGEPSAPVSSAFVRILCSGVRCAPPSAASPQALATSPNQFNHFSPLSPDMTNSALDADPEMNAILGIVSSSATYRGDDDDDEDAIDHSLDDPAIASVNPTKHATPIRQPRGPLVMYSREELLTLSGRSVVPAGFPPLESWFGNPVKQQGNQQHDDPAIASIGGRRAGPGFGEGFGFGGGIGGGRGLSRGPTRNIG